MYDLEISDTLALLKKREEQKGALKFTEDLIEKKIQWLLSILKPICLDGAHAYNADQESHYKVLKDGFSVGVNLEDKTISAHIRLRDGGGEIDEDFDLGDPDRVAKALARFIDPLLVANSIPFKFTKIHVPSSYYMK